MSKETESLEVLHLFDISFHTDTLNHAFMAEVPASCEHGFCKKPSLQLYVDYTILVLAIDFYSFSLGFTFFVSGFFLHVLQKENNKKPCTSPCRQSINYGR